jgi:hypothetical protein
MVTPQLIEHEALLVGQARELTLTVRNADGVPQTPTQFRFRVASPLGETTTNPSPIAAGTYRVQVVFSVAGIWDVRAESDGVEGVWAKRYLVLPHGFTNPA